MCVGVYAWECEIREAEAQKPVCTLHKERCTRSRRNQREREGERERGVREVRP